MRTLGPGKDLGESLEAKIRELGIRALDFAPATPNGRLDVEVIRTRLDDNKYGNGTLGYIPVGAYFGYRYEVTWLNAPSFLPLFSMLGSSVEVAWVPFPSDPATVRTPLTDLPSLPNVEVNISWLVPSLPIRGTFTLGLGGWVTAPLAWDASAARMKQALEALPNVGVVAVHRSPRTVDDGFTWLVTVLDPPGNLPTLVPNNSGLVTAVRPVVQVAEVVAGLGIPELHAVTTRAIHINTVSDVVAVGRPSVPLVGVFRLGLDLSPLSDGGGDSHSEGGVSGPAVTTGWIDVAAVASVADEERNGGRGRDVGESVQAQVRAMLAAAAAATPAGPLHDTLAAMDCSVARSTVAATADNSEGVAWRVTFLNAPAPLPALTVAETNLQAGTTALVGTSVAVVPVTADNSLSGTFTLVVRGQETAQLRHNATAAEVRTALLALRTVRDEYLLVGDVVVARAPRDLQGGYTWHVAFTQENPGAYASLVALGTRLQPQPVGAAVVATLVRPGGQHAVLSLTAMESVGVVSQAGQSLSLRWITGTTARGEVATDGEAAGRIVAGSLRGRLTGESELLDSFGSSANQPSLTIRGPLYAVNRALNAMQYRSAKNWNGLVAVRVTIDDLGNTGSGGALLASRVFTLTVKAVNDAPVLTRPLREPVVAVEDSLSVIPDIRVLDVDSLAARLSVVVNVSHGSVSMGDYSGPGRFMDRTARLETTLVDMNEALASLRYMPDPDYNGFDELVITVWDNGNSADTPNFALTDGGTFSSNVLRVGAVFDPLNDQLAVQEEVQLVRGFPGNIVTNRIHITVLPANDKPYVRMNQTLQSVLEDVDLRLVGIRIDDVDAHEYRNTDRIIQVRVTAVYGTVRFTDVTGLTVVTSAPSNNRGVGENPGPGVGGNVVGTTSITALGTLANINVALGRLVFRSHANFNGRANVTVFIDDRNNVGAPYGLNDTNTVHIDVLPINDPPVVHVPTKVYRIAEDMDAVLVARITDDDTRMGVGVQVRAAFRVCGGGGGLFGRQRLRVPVAAPYPPPCPRVGLDARWCVPGAGHAWLQPVRHLRCAGVACAGGCAAGRGAGPRDVPLGTHRKQHVRERVHRGELRLRDTTAAHAHGPHPERHRVPRPCSGDQRHRT